jgi:rhodanese-related sulfurtransferase
MDYPTTTETFTVEAAFEVPKVSTGAKDGREAIINSAKAYIASGGPTVIPVTKFKEIVDSKDDSYQIVALVAPDHFALGHPAGAFNIPRAKIAKEEALKKLDPDKTVLLYCYQGHNSGLVSMFLGQLGYDVVSAQYGLSAWTNNKEIRAVETYNPGKVKNFATVQ